MFKTECRECSKEITCYGAPEAMEKALRDKGFNCNVCRDCLLFKLDIYGLAPFYEAMKDPNYKPLEVDMTVLTSDEMVRMPKKGSILSDENDHLRKSHKKAAIERTKKQYKKIADSGKTLQDYADGISPK